MATAAAGTADCWRRTTLAGALPRTSAAFLFLSVVAVAAIVSARWITATTAVSRKPLRFLLCRVSIGVSAPLPSRRAVAPHDRENLSLFFLLRFFRKLFSKKILRKRCSRIFFRNMTSDGVTSFSENEE